MRFYYLLLLCLFGCNNKSSKEESDAVFKGEEVYKEKCASCHFVKKQLIGPPMWSYSDSSNLLNRSFNKKSDSHQKIVIDSAELKAIEQYIIRSH